MSSPTYRTYAIKVCLILLTVAAVTVARANLPPHYLITEKQQLKIIHQALLERPTQQARPHRPQKQRAKPTARKTWQVCSRQSCWPTYKADITSGVGGQIAYTFVTNGTSTSQYLQWVVGKPDIRNTYWMYVASGKKGRLTVKQQSPVKYILIGGNSNNNRTTTFTLEYK